MSLGNITITIDEVPYTFSLSSLSGSQRLRLDVDHSNLALPFLLETGTQTSGKTIVVDRHLWKHTLAFQDEVTGEVGVVGAHTVLTVPRQAVITPERSLMAYKLLREGLTVARAQEMISGQTF